MLTEKTFDTGKVKINYAEGPPSGVPMLLLHGVTSRWQTFLPVLPTLSFRYQTYSLDLRGHGQSSHTPGDYFISNDAEDVTAFLRNRVTAPAILLGHSLGSIVSMFVAATKPELVRATILVDPPLPRLSDASDDTYVPPRQEVFTPLLKVMTMGGSIDEQRAALADSMSEADATRVRWRLSGLNQCDPEQVACIIEGRRFEKCQLEELLLKIACPVLLLQGNPELGGALDDRHLQLALSLLADCTHVYLPNVGHGIHLEQPTIFSQMVMEFLESL